MRRAAPLLLILTLRGDVAYDDHLTGPTAQMRYVMPGFATIQSK